MGIITTSPSNRQVSIVNRVGFEPTATLAWVTCALQRVLYKLGRQSVFLQNGRISQNCKLPSTDATDEKIDFSTNGLNSLQYTVPRPGNMVENDFEALWKFRKYLVSYFANSGSPTFDQGQAPYSILLPMTRQISTLLFKLKWKKNMELNGADIRQLTKKKKTCVLFQDEIKSPARQWTTTQLGTLAV